MGLVGMGMTIYQAEMNKKGEWLGQGMSYLLRASGMMMIFHINRKQSLLRASGVMMIFHIEINEDLPRSSGIRKIFLTLIHVK